MRLIIAFFIVLGFGCTSSNDNLPAGLDYFPRMSNLNEGVVFKYYYHRTKKNGLPKTDILYRKMTVEDNFIIKEDFDAAFEKTYHQKIEIIGDQWISIIESSINHRSSYEKPFEEYPYIFEKNIHTDWTGNNAVIDKSVTLDGNGNRLVQTQTQNIDSMANDRKMKIIHSKRKFYRIVDSQQEEPVLLDKMVRYEEGLGMTFSLVSYEEMKYELALDEIITLKEFEKRKNHGMHRVAYIDTLQTIDDYTQYSPCFLPSKINDYYNDKRSGIKGGKGRLRAILKQKLNPEMIKGESGYLAFRFVVNCNGEAGWFTTEEADLNFKEKVFSESTRMHLYKILKAEKEWDIPVIYDTSRDAYTYITFKLKNGEIIEILP